MKTINPMSFVAGRVYSVVYNSDVTMVSKRDGQANPLFGADVTVRRVSTIQAAGGESWTNFLAKRGEQPAGNRKPWCVESELNPCIMVGVSDNTSGQYYLRGFPRGITKEEYFIASQPATSAEVETIRAFKKSSSGDAEFIILNLDKLENVSDLPDDAD